MKLIYKLIYILVILIIILIFINNKQQLLEAITDYNLRKKTNMNCICLICFKPTEEWVKFLSTFSKYDIYIIIDDNSKDYNTEYSKYDNINIIQINDEECEKAGFINMNFTIKKPVTGWEKAIYYFSTINTEYNNVWFFEDDVFFYNEDTLSNVDANYADSDLLSSPYDTNNDGNKDSWWWSKIDIKFPPPYYAAMVCMIRISSKLLSSIKDYANKHNTLFFLETLFSTLCKKNNLKYDTPDELKTIVYDNNYIDADINKHNMYHPMKDINKHIYYRNMLNNN
jgi:hypothetical protein